jgi:hypothetical protein
MALSAVLNIIVEIHSLPRFAQVDHLRWGSQQLERQSSDSWNEGLEQATEWTEEE